MSEMMTIQWPPGLTVSDDPVRKVVRRSSSRTNGWCISTKPRGMRPWESSHEAIFLQIAELDPRVSIVRAQPMRLRIMMGGRASSRVPDFAIMIDGRAEIHEVKEEAEWADPEVQAALCAIEAFVGQFGYRYSVTLDSDLRAEPSLTNMRRIWRNLATPIDPFLIREVRDLLSKTPMSINDIVERTSGPHTVGRPAEACGTVGRINAMLALGAIYFDRDSPLEDGSLVWTSDSGPTPPRWLPFSSPRDLLA